MRNLLLLVLLMLTACAAKTVVQQDSTDSDASYYETANETNERRRARLHTDLGSGYYGQRRVDIALEEFLHAVRIDPNYAPAHNGLGLVYALLGEDRKADSSFRRALRIDPKDSEAYNNYGAYLCSRGKYNESIKQFLTAVKNPLYQSAPLAWLNAGKCAMKKGDEKNAESYFKNALRSQPGLTAASYNLAIIYFNRGKYELASQRFQLAIADGHELTPNELLMGVRISRAIKDANNEASYSLLLRNKYPDSDQAKLLRNPAKK